MEGLVEALEDGGPLVEVEGVQRHQRGPDEAYQVPSVAFPVELTAGYERSAQVGLVHPIQNVRHGTDDLEGALAAVAVEVRVVQS